MYGRGRKKSGKNIKENDSGPAHDNLWGSLERPSRRQTTALFGSQDQQFTRFLQRRKGSKGEEWCCKPGGGLRGGKRKFKGRGKCQSSRDTSSQRDWLQPPETGWYRKKAFRTKESSIPYRITEFSICLPEERKRKESGEPYV